MKVELGEEGGRRVGFGEGRTGVRRGRDGRGQEFSDGEELGVGEEHSRVHV